MSNDHDPAAQLIACLDVLWQQLQYTISDDQGGPPEWDELITALWQTPELVWQMADELAKTHDLIDALAAEQIQQRQKVQRVIASALVGPDGSPLNR